MSVFCWHLINRPIALSDASRQKYAETIFALTAGCSEFAAIPVPRILFHCTAVNIMLLVTKFKESAGRIFSSARTHPSHLRTRCHLCVECLKVSLPETNGGN